MRAYLFYLNKKSYVNSLLVFLEYLRIKYAFYCTSTRMIIEPFNIAHTFS